MSTHVQVYCTRCGVAEAMPASRCVGTSRRGGHCDDGRAATPLRLLLSDARTALSLAWLVYLLASLRALRLRRVRTAAVAVPALTGGTDHSFRAILEGRSPMVFGGARHFGAVCGDVRDASGGVRTLSEREHDVARVRAFRLQRARLLTFGARS